VSDKLFEHTTFTSIYLPSPLPHRAMDLQNHVEPDTTTGNNNNTITVAGRPKKPWKLRQTCDPCSEAKVKCDKGNPRCGRCDRLSYECVYSPTRRIGRPRPRSPRSQDGGGRPARDDGAVIDEANVASEANEDYMAPAIAPAPAPARPSSAQPTEQTPTARHLNLNLNEPLPDCLDDADRWSGSAPASASASSNASSIASRNASHGLLSSLAQPSSLGLDEVRHNPYEYDCATVAVATLRKLAVAGLDGQSASPTPTATASATATQTAAPADVLSDQIPHACRQAARILVCPCSADMDTALLVASLAAAILEVADSALRTLKPAGHALDDEQHTVLALGTLPKISQVVTLFTHRYSVTQASRPPEALLLLAASLRTTLKAMAEETTNRFLDSGAAPSRVEVAAGGRVNDY
jgi:hypothetical protein